MVNDALASISTKSPIAETEENPDPDPKHPEEEGADRPPMDYLR